MAELVNKHFSLDLKDVGDDGHFRGILSTYDNEDLVGDVCDKGCWDASVKAKGGRFPLLWQHDQGEPIGSFQVIDTSVALSIEGSFNQQVRRGQEAYALLRAGDIRGLSVGFNLLEWEYDSNGVRHIRAADLWEGSFVTFPANPLAYAEAKSMQTAATLRRSVAELDVVKSLSEEVRDRILRAIDEAMADADGEAEDEEQKTEGEEPEPEDVPVDAEGKEDDPEAPGAPAPESEDEDEQEVAKALRDLRESLAHLQTAVREV